jgi:CubicO group peptidase (beta-lactamase class C family)
MQQDVMNTTPPDGPSDPAEVDAFLDQVMPAALARYNVPGATVAVVNDGRLVAARGYGYNDLVNRTKIDGDTTLFRIGSCSKLVTWTAVMQLVDEGKIDLDADVNTYLTDFEIPDTYPGHPVTMRNLMTHTAGFEDTARHSTAASTAGITSIHQYCKENIPARIASPGTVTQYSNYGATLAAVVVEEVSGMPFEQYAQSRIFTPLGMTNTSLREDLPPAFASRLTKGYTYDGSQNVATPDEIIIMAPAGAISSTAPDMAKFMIAHLQNGTYGNATILSKNVSDLMHARAFSNDPRVAGMALGFYEQFYNGKRAIEHSGDTTAFHSLLVLLPDENAGFFVSSNSPGGTMVRDELFAAFMDHYYPAQPRVLPAPDANPSIGLQKYAGTYMSNRHAYTKFEKNNHPAGQVSVTVTPRGTIVIAMGASSTEYMEIAPGVFARADGTSSVGGDVVFHTAPDGSVDYMCSVNMPIFVYSRVPWYGTDGFMDGLKTASAIVLVSVLLWPLLALFRRTHRVPEPVVPRSEAAARWTAGISALVLLVFVYFLEPYAMTDPGIIMPYIYPGPTPAILIAVCTLPVIVLVLALACIAFTALAWKEKYWTAPHRVHYTLVTVALFAMLWWVITNCLWVFSL